MSKWREIYSQHLNRKPWKETIRRTKAPEVIERLIAQAGTRYPEALRELGHSESGPVLLSEEDRESHIHILGSPGEGKSKFLEMMLSLDIKNLQKGILKSGACFLDSTENGSTMRKVLKYCAQQGFTKVVLIDPHHIWNKKFEFVCSLNPLHYEDAADDAAGHVTDIIRILWATKDPAQESIIRKYLPRVVRALHASRTTLPDAECLTIKELLGQRKQVIDHEGLDVPTKLVLNRVYNNVLEWRDFQSTCRRLDPFFDNQTMKLLFGSLKGLNFEKIIREGWIVLVNMTPEGVYNTEHQRLVGTVIINELISALSGMVRNGYTVPYYLYIDEVGHYATSKLADILDYTRHLSLRLAIAHQRFQQIEDASVMSAIRTGAKSKILFYTADNFDRMAFVKLMYGGDLPDRDVAYALSQTQKKHAVIRINKKTPVMTRLKEWPDAVVSDKALDDFILKIYNNNPDFYRKPDEVRNEVINRFSYAKRPKGRTTSPPDTGQPPGGTSADGGTTKPSESPRQERPRVKTIFTKGRGKGETGGVQPDPKSPPESPKD